MIKGMAFVLAALLLLPGRVLAQDLDYSLDSKQTQAVLNGGVSYDLLRTPTSVSFDTPEGYLSFNIPLDLTTNKYDLGAKLDSSQKKFTPLIGARQRLNYSFRVNVPVFRGVLSYAQTENVNFDFGMNLGTRIQIDTTMFQGDTSNSASLQDSLHLNLLGGINLPIQYQMGWRTQTFGYAFKPHKDVVVAVNLYKHLFEATANGTVSTNILGNIGVSMPSVSKTMDIPINYSEEDVYGKISGNFKGSAWSPAFGIKWWRLTYTSRFGVTTKVRGHLTMKWTTPFFVNPSPQNFGVDNNALIPDDSGKSAMQMLDDFQRLQNRLDASETDSFVINTERPMEFNIPSGQTLAFEAIRNHLVFSYTFIHGGAISGYHKNEAGDVDINLGINVQHFLVMNAAIGRAKMTLGAFLLDFYEQKKTNWLSKSLGFGSLGGVPMPILNFSTSVGGAARLLMELDVLPIPALKSGVVYYF